MTSLRAGIALLLLQPVLVLSIAGKYLYDRNTRPRVWARATQFDPNQPLRGRYLALQLVVDACALPRDEAHYTRTYIVSNSAAPPTRGAWHWQVSLEAHNGYLLPVLADNPSDPSTTQLLVLPEGRPCNRVPAPAEEELFLPEHANLPFPLKLAQELWVEVTIPKEGPPRPIQLALSDPSGFHPLQLR